LLIASWVQAGDIDDLAASSCELEQQYLSQKNSPTVNIKAQDWSCFTSLDQIESQSVLPIDVRNEDARSKQSIFGALLVDLEQVNSKRIFKEKNILLLTDGFSRIKPAQVCSELKINGFKQPKILTGGIREWLLRGGKPDTQPPSYELEFIQAQQLLIEALSNNVTLITFNKLDHELASSLSDQAFILDYTKKAKFLDRFLKITETHSKGGLYPIVIIGSEQDYRSLKVNVFSDGLPISAFYLKGGLKAIERQIEVTEIVSKSRNSIPNRYRCNG